MATLLGRTLTSGEQAILEPVRDCLASPRKAPRDLWRDLGLPAPAPLFAVVLSLIQVPPVTLEHRALCDYLISVPEFLPFLSSPDSFSRAAFVLIGRAMLLVDSRFDAKLANVLFTQDPPQTQSLLHVLGALDEISPGGRLTLTLARLLRDCSPAVASKVAMLLARRVSNPTWVDSQLSSGNPRLRANIVESLWGVDTPHVRARLTKAIEDSNNRVAGNALYGLHLLKDHRVAHHLQSMLAHEHPSFRATAAWVVGKTGERRYREPLLRVLGDRNSTVRDAARRAILNLPAEENSCPAPHTAPPLVTDQLPQPPPQPEPAIETPTPSAPHNESPRDTSFNLNLDGSFKQLARKS
ncbi:HEAT repeat domain-containing protein [Paludibaculum fermentans]|uniref:HEAT repeat domain-containing protein n=1 Tax=Paludibaculum fermentans TaxID=1473598 RepID=UPI003EBC4396